MRLLIDLDGIAADFYGSILSIYNAEFGENLTPADVRTWEFSPEVFTKSTEEHIAEYFNRPGFWSELTPIKGAVESLKYLHGQGHVLKIVTAVPTHSPRCCYEKLMWVENHLPFIGHDNFHATKDKAGVRGDLLFDDAIHNIDTFPGLTCVLDTAYNQEANADFRVNSWESFIKVIEGITV
jgi:5'-nucleotidase